MRRLFLVFAAIACLAAALVFRSSEANAVFWRGITAPTNIDIHGWPIIKEPPRSPCQWTRLSGGYYVRQCINGSANGPRRRSSRQLAVPKNPLILNPAGSWWATPLPARRGPAVLPDL